jgi:transposase-like protein
MLLRHIEESELIPETTELCQVKYLDNLIEQDNRFIKRRVSCLESSRYSSFSLEAGHLLE